MNMTTSLISRVALLGSILAAAAAGAVTPLYRNSAGSISRTSIAYLGTPGWVVTAVRNGGGDLEVIVWQDTATAIVRKGSATAGVIQEVAVAAAPTGLPNSVVTAVVNSTGNLELIEWVVDSSGNVTRFPSLTTSIKATKV